MTCLYKETQQDSYWSWMNHSISTQVILTRKFVKERNFDFKLLSIEEQPKKLLDEPRGILQTQNHIVFYIHPKLNLSVSVLGLLLPNSRKRQLTKADYCQKRSWKIYKLKMQVQEVKSAPLLSIALGKELHLNIRWQPVEPMKCWL